MTHRLWESLQGTSGEMRNEPPALWLGPKTGLPAGPRGTDVRVRCLCSSSAQGAEEAVQTGSPETAE